MVKRLVETLIVSGRSTRGWARPSWTPTAWCLTPPSPSSLLTTATWASMSPYPCAEWSFAVLPPRRSLWQRKPVTLTLKWSDCFWPFKKREEWRQCSTEEIGHYWLTTCTGRPLKSCTIFTQLTGQCAYYSHPNLFCNFLHLNWFFSLISQTAQDLLTVDARWTYFSTWFLNILAWNWNLYNWDCDRL